MLHVMRNVWHVVCHLLLLWTLLLLLPPPTSLLLQGPQLWRQNCTCATDKFLCHFLWGAVPAHKIKPGRNDDLESVTTQ